MISFSLRWRSDTLCFSRLLSVEFLVDGTGYDAMSVEGRRWRFASTLTDYECRRIGYRELHAFEKVRRGINLGLLLFIVMSFLRIQHDL